MYKPENDSDIYVDICAFDNHVDAAPGLPMPYTLTLYDRFGTRHAGTWAAPEPETQGQELVRKASITVAPTFVDGEKMLIVSFLYELDNIPVHEMIPNDFGQKSGIVERLSALIRGLNSPAIQNFVDDVFCLRTVFRSFWTCPGSQKHHHSYKGGLAEHSIEMAEWVANANQLTAEERDIGIAYALLHDIGKLWCYGKNGLTGFQDIGHELAGLSHIGRPLERLDIAWPDAGIGLRSMLSGMWRLNRSRPIPAVAKLVHAFDQYSVEKDLRLHKVPGHSPWTPRPQPASATLA